MDVLDQTIWLLPGIVLSTLDLLATTFIVGPSFVKSTSLPPSSTAPTVSRLGSSNKAGMDLFLNCYRTHKQDFRRGPYGFKEPCPLHIESFLHQALSLRRIFACIPDTNSDWTCFNVARS